MKRVIVVRHNYEPTAHEQPIGYAHIHKVYEDGSFWTVAHVAPLYPGTAANDQILLDVAQVLARRMHWEMPTRVYSEAEARAMRDDIDCYPAIES